MRQGDHEPLTTWQDDANDQLIRGGYQESLPDQTVAGCLRTGGYSSQPSIPLPADHRPLQATVQSVATSTSFGGSRLASPGRYRAPLDHQVLLEERGRRPQEMELGRKLERRQKEQEAREWERKQQERVKDSKVGEKRKR
ncbi:hypothetical protein T440DRAFT_471135 [Plenodomus tracheiphilus IPT5]|uniref:Uncharacterized protein n=1 Tax=Plenodomus tracheiphilus IPT5 TaxID=1408161 RepID=A0A6A7AX93_9PLEO|nr:hypothetical protein T440DRAFT_471135 [Plenodomus tracheiphilus IPT5]